MTPRPIYPANRVLALLVASVAINYVDRGALSVSAPYIVREMSLSASQMGLLFSAFFWSYSIFHLLAGVLADRYDVKRVFGAGYLLWSLATASVGWVFRFDWLFGARMLLGVGESVAYPSYSRILSREFPERRRGFANALLDVGSKLGPAAATLVGALVVDRFGWRMLFLALGVGGLVWLIPWAVWTPAAGTRVVGARDNGHCPGMLDVLRLREAWGTCFGMFALGYVWYFLLSWLPSYLIAERGFSMKSVSVLGSLPFFAMAGSSLLAGWLSDRWIRSGASVTLVRKTFVTSGLLLCCVTLLPAAAVRQPSLCVVLLILSCAALGLFTSNVWAITQTLAGPTASGTWTGVQNAIGNLGGVVSPALTGLIVDWTGSYYLAFAAASVMLIVGAASYLTLVREVRPVNWDGSVALSATP